MDNATTKDFEINWILMHCRVPARTGSCVIKAVNKKAARASFKETYDRYESAADKYKIVSVVALGA